MPETPKHVSPYHQNLRHSAEALINAVMYAYSAEVEGDVLEFGVMGGSTARVISFAMQSCHATDIRLKRKRLHLFDSFKGLPQEEADKDAPHVASGTWAQGKCSHGMALESKIFTPGLLDPSSVDIRDGWYEQTVPAYIAEAKKAETYASVLHVDCDLYTSTMQAIGPLLTAGRVSEGAILLFDDWNCNRASPKHGERRAWRELVDRHGIEFSDEGSYALFGRKFIVHDYR